MSSKRFTIEEVADEIHVTPSTVYRLMKEGRLAYVAVTNKKRLVTEEQLEAFFAASSIDAGS
jgi:excisionase family DNA binding protein